MQNALRQAFDLYRSQAVFEAAGSPRPFTVCVDFDGTMAEDEDGFKGRNVFGDLLPDCAETMAWLKDMGCRLIIHTVRPDTPEFRAYLKANAVPFDYINVNPDQPEDANQGKPIADLYIDDRGWRFKGWLDFKYAFEAMKKEQLLESAASDDWQGLRALFESGSDDAVLVLGETPEESDRLSAIANIKRAKDFQTMADWFADYFDKGPASAFYGLRDVAKNLEAIMALAAELKALKAIYDDPTADIEDRLDASKRINEANYPMVKLGNGNSITKRVFETVSGYTMESVPTPISKNEYGDLKLQQYRDKAKSVYEAAGIHPENALLRASEIRAELTNIFRDHQAVTDPIIEAHNRRKDAALERLKSELDAVEARADEGHALFRQKREAHYEVGPTLPGYGATPDQKAEYRRQQEEWLKRLDEIEAERQEFYKGIQRERVALHDQADREAGDLNAELGPLNQKYEDAVAPLRAELEGLLNFGEKIKAHVIETSPVSAKAADDWFDSMVMLPKNVLSTLKSRGYDKDALRRDMTEFYRLTGGRLPRISFDVKRGSRASAFTQTGVVNVAGQFPKQTFFHEMAHILEDDERTKTVAHRFLDQRTGRESGEKLYTLRSLSGNPRYRASEKAYKDSFIDPYVGKYYSWGTTEVFSMGMQFFSSPKDMARLYEKDPDHFNFMLGYMATPPRLDAVKVGQQQAEMAAKKDAIQTTDDFLKALDKKIAKAGDFWIKEGFTIEHSYKNTFYATFPMGEGLGRFGRGHTWVVKGEKNLKRALWVYFSAGKQDQGPYSLERLIDIFRHGGKVTIPKEMAKDQAILEGPA